MQISEESIVTSATPAAVWKLLSDIPGWAAWDPSVTRAETNGPLVPGTVVRLTSRDDGTVDGLVAEVVDGVSFAMALSPTIRVGYRVATWAGQTRVYLRAEVSGGPDEAGMARQIAVGFSATLAALAAAA